MEAELMQQWYKVGGTNIYTTGHYAVSKREVKTIFQSEIFDNGGNLAKVENNELVTSRMKSDRRIIFNFIPLKTHDKYLMEGNASRVALDEIEDILPYQLKRILVRKRRVRYKGN